MPDIQPNTPEAKKLARKVGDIFYWIAAANIVLVAIVFWPRAEKPFPPDELAAPAAASTPTPAAMHDMESAFTNALADFNAKDETRFASHFSAQAVPPMDTHFFQKVIVGIYHLEFGEVLSKKINNTETAADADYGMLVYEVDCKKQAKVKLSVNFRREGGVMKIVQWRMEKAVVI